MSTAAAKKATSTRTVKPDAYQLGDGWYSDPYLFGEQALGVNYFTPDQRELIESVRENRFTACTSGNATGKSFALAFIALWFGTTRMDSRVITTAASWESSRTSSGARSGRCTGTRSGTSAAGS